MADNLITFLRYVSYYGVKSTNLVKLLDCDVVDKLQLTLTRPEFYK